MNEIKNRLTQLIKEGKFVLSTKYRPINQLHPMQQCPYIVNKNKFSKWRIKSLVCLDEILMNDDIRLKKFNEEVSDNNPSDTVNGIGILESIIDDIDSGVFKLKNKNKHQTSKIEILELIFNNFHTIAKQLTYRRENRSTLHIDDEYDVQDLLNALLLIPFDDIWRVGLNTIVIAEIERQRARLFIETAGVQCFDGNTLERAIVGLQLLLRDGERQAQRVPCTVLIERAAVDGEVVGTAFVGLDKIFVVGIVEQEPIGNI